MLGQPSLPDDPRFSNMVERVRNRALTARRRGLIERDPDPADRRVRLLSLTAAGQDLHSSVRAAIRAAERGFLDRLSTGDEQRFLRSLEILSEGGAKPDAS